MRFIRKRRLSGREADQQERLEKFQKARAAYAQALEYKEWADALFEQAKDKFEAAKGELRKVSDEAWPR